ncbi:pectin lyase-like superfamily protein [Actinidia rufa]|uniref:Pectin lyase-like superfamily protein n=1 Tax=Actinidia rufa TaxID=165716 RepID=A0A7J0GJV6_9ERIC|nr:pectin lyase-like superfamily protein [Actinidia rufa]
MGNRHGCCFRTRGSDGANSHLSPPINSEVPPYKLVSPDHPPPSSSFSGPNMASLSLPYPHADDSLRALSGLAEGFGHSAVGGLHGPLYHVTSLAGPISLSSLYIHTFSRHPQPPSSEALEGKWGGEGNLLGYGREKVAVIDEDDGPGSLREGCRKKEPLWIVFEVSGTIALSSYLSVSSYKTIDGRGQKIKLSGKGLRLKECEHVIICNLEFEGGRGPDADAIQIKPNSKHIWIDRCSLSNYDDGLIDITRESTYITVSRCHFSNHNKTMLIGADPTHTGDRSIRVTIHHCFFDGTRQRHPRVRFGKVHLYNNYTRNWGIYAVCASVESQIYSQCNIYEAGQKKVAFKYLTEKAADKSEENTGCIKSEGDLFVHGTQPGFPTTASAVTVFHPSEYYSTWTVEAPTDALKKVLQRFAGWQRVPRPADITK